MKFSTKVTLSTVALLCVTLSIGGAWNIRQNFAWARQNALGGYTSDHQRTCFALETKFCNGESGNLSVEEIFNASHSLIQEGVGDKMQIALVSPQGTVLFSNVANTIPYADLLSAMEAGSQSASFLKSDGHNWVMMATPLQGLSRPLWLAQVWDATPLFQERDRQIWQHLILSTIVILTAGTVASVGSYLLTRPLRQLEQASLALAAGELDARVKLTTGDEIQQIGKEFNRMADAICNQMDALRDESERQKRFVAAFSHELKTPMTAMLGYAAMLEKGQLPPAQQSKAAGYIFRESTRLETLSRQLMQLMQLQTGGVQLSPARIAPILKAATLDLPDLPVRLNIECPPEAAGRVNGPLLTDLVRNLVLNAAASEPKDGIVRLGCEKIDGRWTLWVSDQGRGIPADSLPRVTEPFFRVDRGRSRSEGGNGLGLALCKMIAEAHGSGLHFESRINEGTRVWMTLPECDIEGGDAET